MKDALTIIFEYVDIITAGRIRMSCKRLSGYKLEPKLHVRKVAAGDLLPKELDNTLLRCITDIREYRCRGELHNLELPALTYYIGQSTVVLSWYAGGRRHRADGPAYQKFVITHNIPRQIVTTSDLWWYFGTVYREDVLGYIYSEKIKWYVRGVMHREDGPAYICNNKIKWYVRGVLHREDGPAFIRLCIHGDAGYTCPYITEYAKYTREHHLIGGLYSLLDSPINNSRVEWRIHGILHRDTGPAVILPKSLEYWILGTRISANKRITYHASGHTQAQKKYFKIDKKSSIRDRNKRVYIPKHK